MEDKRLISPRMKRTTDGERGYLHSSSRIAYLDLSVLNTASIETTNNMEHLLEMWTEISELVHGSPHTTEDLINHVSEVLVMLRSDNESVRRKAVQEIAVMCHPKYLGDNRIPEVGWKRWNELLETARLKVEETLSRDDYRRN